MKLCLLWLISGLAVLAHADSVRRYQGGTKLAPTGAKYNAANQVAKSQQHYSSSSTADKDSQILRNEIDVNPDGAYHYAFETSNGIKREEQASAGGTPIQGSSSYTSPEGVEVKFSYTADENGYHPVGDHIPQIPDYILRSLEYIRAHPYNEKDYYSGEFRKAAPITTPVRPATSTFAPPAPRKVQPTKRFNTGSFNNKPTVRRSQPFQKKGI